MANRAIRRNNLRHPTGRIEAVYREHHQRLWRSLLGYTGDRELADEAESEAFAQALRRGDAIDEPAAWIWRTAFRIAAGLLAERADRPRPMAEAPEPPRAGPVPDPLVEILSLLGTLSTQQRAVVVLRHVAGLKPTEIAELLDTTPGTVRVQLHRAHASLRATWSEA